MTPDNGNSLRDFAELPSRDDDRWLMTALGNGDDRAFSRIMKRWQDPIFAFLCRTMGDDETALDLSEKVFVEVYRNRWAYSSKERFSTWIFRIATRLARKELRRTRRERRSPPKRKEPEGNPDETGAAGNVARSMEGPRVREAVLALPEDLRIPLVLFHYQELSPPEVARITGGSEKSIGARIEQAKGRLAESLLEGNRAGEVH